MPVAKRTRLQSALRNELSEKNGEDVKVVSEVEYMRRVSMSKVRQSCEDSSVNGCLGNAMYDDSVHNHVDRGCRKIHHRVLDDVRFGDEDYIQWLRCEYENKSPKKIVVEISSESETLCGSKNESPKNIDVETEIFGGSENKSLDNIDNETEILGGFDNESRVETEILAGSENESPENIDVETDIIDTSGNESPKSNDVEIGREIENGGNRKKGTLSKNRKGGIETAPEKKTVSEKCSSCESGVRSKRIRRTKGKNVVDERYLKWISCIKNVNQGESHKNIHVNKKSKLESYSKSANIKKRWLPKYRNGGIPSELEAKNGGNRKRGRPRKDKNVAEDGTASSFVHLSSVPYYRSYAKGGDGKRGRSSKKRFNGSKFEPGNIGCSENGGTRPKKKARCTGRSSGNVH